MIYNKGFLSFSSFLGDLNLLYQFISFFNLKFFDLLLSRYLKYFVMYTFIYPLSFLFLEFYELDSYFKIFVNVLIFLI